MMSGSSSSATVRVDKATSDLLMNPDWAMNMDICDYVNTYPGQARDVLKAVKKRLQHKSPKVQFLALTLLETMVKNCGDYVHFQIVDKNILDDMVKIVKKKTDVNVRDKTLVLLDAWQEAFGGRGGKYPQYYYAYDELRRSGVHFPQRSPLAAPPIFTPPVAHPGSTHVQGYGMPSNSSRRLDEAMASERESLSVATLDSMQNVTEVLSDMLQAMNPGDAVATRDDVVVDLVDRCRANQKKLMQMLTTTEDEELLGRGLELHDSMQTLLAKHDAIASGSEMPSQTTNLVPPTAEKSSLRLDENETKQDKSPRPSVSPTASAATATSGGLIDEEEEEDDDFAQLARRHSKQQPISQRTAETAESSTSSLESPAATSKALTLPDPPAPVRTSREQDMIDLLSLALTTTSPYAQDTPQSPPATGQNVPVSPNGPSDAYAAHANPSNGQVQVPLQSYVVPWAQPQTQQQSFTQLPPQRSFTQQPQQPFMQQQQPQQQSFPQQMRQSPQQQSYMQPPQQQSYAQQQQQHYQSNTYGYPPPPWATPSSGSSNYQHPANSAFQTVGTELSYGMREGIKPSLQSSNSFSSRGSNGLSANPVNGSSLTGQKPYIPPYRLFEDLNVLGNRESGNQTTGSSASSTSLSGQNKVGGWR